MQRPESQSSAASLADRLQEVLESADLVELGSLLDPDVTWGAPGDPNPSCRNREQVLSWYGRGRDAGTTARVTEVAVHGENLLVGLMVRRGGAYGERWQVMAVGPRGVTDIRGYEDRASATAALGG